MDDLPKDLPQYPTSGLGIPLLETQSQYHGMKHTYMNLFKALLPRAIHSINSSGARCWIGCYKYKEK